MKTAYPLVIKKGQKLLIGYVPDFDINTQGKDVPEVMEMGRDAIGACGIDMQDDGIQVPPPSDIADVLRLYPDDIVTLVDINFDEYRRRNEMRAVKKNCTIPGWLNYEAEKANINFSGVLQQALIEKLNISK